MITLLTLLVSVALTDEQHLAMMIPKPDPAFQRPPAMRLLMALPSGDDCGACNTNPGVINPDYLKSVTLTWTQQGKCYGWNISNAPSASGPWQYDGSTIELNNTNNIKKYITSNTNSVRFYQVTSY